MSLAPRPQSDSPAPSASAAPQAAPLRPVTRRSVLIGLALIPPNIIWIVLMERVDGRVFSTTISLFYTAAFSLFLLVMANRLLQRFAPRRALRQGEMLTIFSMLSLGTAMAGVDFMSPLMTLMAHGFWLATPENGWEKFWPYLPRWLTVQDRAALKGYYLGNATLYDPVALRAWLPPLLCWTAFILALLWVMACLNVIIRAQWTEKERLTYPVAQLPIAMTQEQGTLYQSRLFLIGFALAAGLNFINGMHFLFPSVPALTFNGFDAGQWFTSRPWNAVGWTPLAIFPFVVGLGYLLPVDLLFSCWFFFIFWRMEKVAASALGFMAEQPRFPYVDEQMFGGYMAICLFALWMARSHLQDVWRAAIQNPQTTIQNAHDPMRFRTAVFGAIGGFLFLSVFAWKAGLPFHLSLLFFVIYFAIAFAVTRMRAELGPPTHDLHFIGPYQTLYTLFGSRNLGGPALGVLTLFFWFNRAYRCHPMPHQLEGFKMAQASGTSARGLVPAMMLGALAGIVVTAWVTLHVSYHLGAAARIHGWSSLGYGNEAYARLSGWIASPSNPDVPAILGMAVGFLAAAGLILIKMNVYGWPFHALGFSISGGWSMMWAWLSLFVAWVLKALILRYGGLRAYRAGIPFFFGVILGDFLVGGVWAILGLLFDMPIYSVWSG